MSWMTHDRISMTMTRMKRLSMAQHVVRCETTDDVALTLTVASAADAAGGDATYLAHWSSSVHSID